MSIWEISQAAVLICSWLVSLAVMLILTGLKWKSEGRLLKDPERKEKEGGCLQQLGKLALIFAVFLLLLVVVYLIVAIFAVVAMCSG